MRNDRDRRRLQLKIFYTGAYISNFIFALTLAHYQENIKGFSILKDSADRFLLISSTLNLSKQPVKIFLIGFLIGKFLVDQDILIIILL